MKKVFLMFVLLVMQPLYALDAQQFEDMLTQYQKAVDGDGNARDSVKKLLDSYAKQEPDNALIRVYQGSVMTLEGRDAWMPWNKMRYTERGLDVMEQALNMSQGSDEVPVYLNRSIEMEVKMISAITFTQVPKMFGRFEQGVELLDSITVDSGYRQFSDKQKVQYLFYRAMAAEKDDLVDDAKNYYQKVVDMGINDKIQIKAKEALERL